MRLIDELHTFYNTKSRILDLTNGRLPAVHMVKKLIITSHQLPCNTSMKKLDSIIGHVHRIVANILTLRGYIQVWQVIFRFGANLLNTYTWSKQFSEINFRKMNRISKISEN